MKYWEPIEDNKMRFRAHDEFIKANGFTKYFLYSNQKSIEKILKVAPLRLLELLVKVRMFHI